MIYKLQTSFSALVQPDNHVVQKSDTRKIYQLSNEVIFFAPFFVCFSLFAFKLGATAMLCVRTVIGLFTRPEIKSSPDVKFCAHAQCVLPRCWSEQVFHSVRLGYNTEMH